MAKQAQGKTSNNEGIRISLMILNLLRHDIQKTAKDIHLELQELGVEIGLRSVYHRLNMLCDSFPQHIYAIKKSPPFGYKRPSLQKKSSSMSPTEAIAISLADKYLDSILPKFSKNMSPYIAEAEEVLNETYSQKFNDWRSKVSFSSEQFELMPAKTKPEILMQIHLSILESKDLDLMYSSRRKSNKRVALNIIPIGLAHRGRISYVLGYFKDGDRCYLPTNRIFSCEIGDRHVQKHKYTMTDFEKDKILEFSHNQKIKLKLKFNETAGHIFLETPISNTQTIKKSHGHFILEDEVIFTESLFFWLSSFGDNVEIMQPKFLRQRMIDTLKSTLGNYNG